MSCARDIANGWGREKHKWYSDAAIIPNIYNNLSITVALQHYDNTVIYAGLINVEK